MYIQEITERKQQRPPVRAKTALYEILECHSSITRLKQNLIQIL